MRLYSRRTMWVPDSTLDHVCSLPFILIYFFIILPFQVFLLYQYFPHSMTNIILQLCELAFRTPIYHVQICLLTKRWSTVCILWSVKLIHTDVNILSIDKPQMFLCTYGFYVPNAEWRRSLYVGALYMVWWLAIKLRVHFFIHLK